MACSKSIVWFCVQILLCLFFLLSCNSKHTKNEELILHAEQLLKQHPDSTLVLLQSVEAPNKLAKAQKADYYILLAQAKLKMDDQILQDSLTLGLTESVEYFLKEKENEKLAWAYYLRSRSYYDSNEELGDIQKSMLDGLEAKKYAEIIHNNYLLALIHQEMGNNYYAQYNNDEALENHKLSRQYYPKEERAKIEIILCGKIGSVYNMAKQYDSALIYQKRALEYSYLSGDTTQYNRYVQASLYKNIGYSYKMQGNIEAEKGALLKAYHTIPENKIADINIIIYSLSQAYAKLNKLDSAIYYANKFISHENETSRETLLRAHHWYKLYKETGNYELALKNLEWCMQKIDAIHNESMSHSVLEIQKKYDKEVIENRYNQVLVQRLYLVIGIIALVLLGVIAIWIFRNRIKHKETELRDAEQVLQVFKGMLDSRDKQLQTFDQTLTERNEQLQNYSQLLSEQAEQLQDYSRVLTERDAKSEQLRATLANSLDIARRVAQMNVVSTENNQAFMKQFHKVFGKNLLDWEFISPVINDLYNGFVDKIKTTYPQLGSKDLQLCCFVRAGFRTEELAVLLDYTQSTIRVKRAQLVKKMGFDSAESFLSYLMKE